MSIPHILWDHSSLWGLLIARAIRAMAPPCRLVSCRDIAHGLLTRERPALLIVPGGNARHKAESLGAAGIAAIREYVRAGGQYLGFCGGAGLALTWGEGPSGLALCPWQRASYDDRLQHFMSGHLHVTLAVRQAPSTATDPAGQAASEKNGKSACALIPHSMPESPLLPVWWPGRFAPEANGDIHVLASYDCPGEDFWLADLALADLPPGTFGVWRDLYGLSLTPTFLAGQPCVIHGRYGAGNYILSYSHLETPASPHANRWLAHLLRVLGGLSPTCDLAPPWRPQSEHALWDDPDLNRLERSFDAVLQTGFRHGLLFSRTDWLLGWRTGIPGANLNNIRAAISLIRSLPPTEKAHAYWLKQRKILPALAEAFSKGVIQYLLAERLAQTLPSAVPAAVLKEQRETLFGPPMREGGLYQPIIAVLDRLACLQLS